MINSIWDDYLTLSELRNKQWVKDINTFIESIYLTKPKTCPDKDNIFKMFKILFPLEIKVVMIFQDPYSQLRKDKCVSNGIGLSASYLTPSLKHFFQAIDSNIKNKDIDISMISLVKQGVFSINKYLTVAKKPLSHSPYEISIEDRPLRWDYLMELFVYKLNENEKHLVYLLFGREAQELSKHIDKTKNLVIETSHPSPRGYKYGLMESNFAQKTNEYLKKHNKSIIKWT